VSSSYFYYTRRLYMCPHTNTTELRAIYMCAHPTSTTPVANTLA
jgi:hypothetical protein